MKKLVFFATVVVLTLSLIACAQMNKKEKTHVKCPACGYEFDLVR